MAENPVSDAEDLFIVVSTAGFDSPDRVKSALMFATLAATAEYKTILFCIQSMVDIMVKGAIGKNEVPKPGLPTIAQRLEEAIEMGVEIQCCSQTLANKKLKEEDFIPGVKIAGAMNLITLVTGAKGTLTF